jgi:hypothetical protein
MKVTSLEKWHGFTTGQQVRMLIETRGAAADDREVAFPVGSHATIVAIADFGDHQGYGVDLVIGEGDNTICNSYDDSDANALGHLPFRSI